ncbi:Isoleucine--tRNA ligase [Dissostichus eleginoides]|uniref:Isoleucine--tRNA ligase n=1 Tax=Dissostichus eleginoides TaxID=100907 RepID=A0AAD9EW39_DISEL|nr:Isoleucine--tRNA ligase [Dissostichus eleginoides]
MWLQISWEEYDQPEEALEGAPYSYLCHDPRDEYSKTATWCKESEETVTIPAAFSSSGPKYKADSLEQGTKEKVIAQWIGRTGLPARTVEDEDFILMMETFDKRLNIPKEN